MKETNNIFVWLAVYEDGREIISQNQEGLQRFSPYKFRMGDIREIKKMKVYFDVKHTDASADVMLDTEFLTLDDLNTYAVHPEHLKVAEFVKSVVSSRVVLDAEIQEIVSDLAIDGFLELLDQFLRTALPAAVEADGIFIEETDLLKITAGIFPFCLATGQENIPVQGIQLPESQAIFLAADHIFK